MNLVCAQLVFAVTLWTAGAEAGIVAVCSGTSLLQAEQLSMEAEVRNSSDGSTFRVRRRRFISGKDMTALLDYHNRVRSQVFPPAANMEYMVWDERLAKSAEFWASQCIWEHGPHHFLQHIGQNLSIISGRYKSIIDLVKSWYDERHSFSYPSRCSGSVCTHYTQMVWAASNKIGCAIKKCSDIFVFGSMWKQATLLVCNYAIKGNWVGEAPYKIGRPCSACPSSYGGSCNKNQCDSRPKSRRNTNGFRGYKQ
ncbi:peptidase inhibitor R3HDML precursor [Danio rerio]|uniref:R3H domain containing-like precursor n=1 Tax=Danio rerio TaxID=7955 RepID=E7EZY0_DANRE|nr:R3H domain containing-like precursor [Danio rerio]|eukprot:XP_690466.2 peptidase inhibitor R3HDML [Danio rerio]